MPGSLYFSQDFSAMSESDAGIRPTYLISQDDRYWQVLTYSRIAFDRQNYLRETCSSIALFIARLPLLRKTNLPKGI